MFINKFQHYLVIICIVMKIEEKIKNLKLLKKY